MRRAGELAFVKAVSEALPWSFGALAVAFATILTLQYVQGSAAGQPALGFRLAAALLPAFGVMSAALAAILAWFVAKRTGYSLPPVALAGVASFALALPRGPAASAIDYLRTLGAAGLFVAILACGAVAASIALARRLLHGRAADWAGAAFATACFAALFAAHFSPASFILAALKPIAYLGDSYVALVLIVAIETLLWTAGVHGPALLAAVVTPVYLTMQAQNTHAYYAHVPLPFVVVVSLFLFVFPGGAGATLPLAAMLAVSRVPRLRRVGRVTLIPALFNINDPLLFGTPVVFNPYFVVPFVGAPLVLATVTYAAVAWGLVARAAFYVPSSVPSVVGAYLATWDVRSIALVAFNVVLAGVIYYPFVRAYERHELEAVP